MTTTTFEPRALCSRCMRPTRVCVCRLLPALAPQARVIILQHPRERGMAIGTAKMASRCLAGSSVIVGTHVDAHPTVVAALADKTRRPVLLWPGPGAKDLAVEQPTGPITLFVVDGTWTLAGKMIGFNPVIAALPRYAISPKSPSEYRIRREPRAECLSTIEAVSNALGLLENEPERYRAMMDPFRAMIDAQIAEMARGPRPRDKSKLMLKRRKVWAMPEPLADLSRVVVIAAEANAWPVDAKARHPDEIVHWLAIRGDESERFERIVRPTQPLAPSTPAHTELSTAVLLGGDRKDDALAALRAFVRRGDAIATWGGYATRWIGDSGLSVGAPTFDMRQVAARALRASPGSMERCAETLGLVPRRLGQGRGGRRLGVMLAMLRGLATRSGLRPVVSPERV